MSLAVEWANNYAKCIDEQRFDDAYNLLDDSFTMKTPKKNCDSKEQWMTEFVPEAKKGSQPSFEAFEPGDHDKQARRKGSKKVAIVTMSVLQTFDFTDDGKIKSIVLAKA